MGETYLIDTNIIIYFLNGSLSDNARAFLKNILLSNPVTSFVSQIEALAYPDITSSEEARAVELLGSFRIIWMDEAILRETVNVRKKHKLKFADSLIAATALTNDFTLFTANTQDFRKVNGLKLLHPSTL